jgi:SAM-dependent methyltransferase
MTTKPCISCQKSNLKLVLSLGTTPLANSLLTASQLEQPEPCYPLDLAFCPDCTMVQILESVSPDRLFRDYVYFSSFSDTMLQHSEKLVSEVCTQRQLDTNSLVVEMASNDGYLLQFYKQIGIPVLGIEPALNIAKVAQERGIPTITEFFGEELAHQLVGQGKQADIIHAHNVLAHVPDLNGFVKGIQILLKPTGQAVIEAPYVKEMLDHSEFDTIYHEHLCYFSLTTLNQLFTQHDLLIRSVERVNIHGGSLRLKVVRLESQEGQIGADASVVRLLQEEQEWGVHSFSAYEDFAKRVNELKTALVDLLATLKGQGKTIWAYGAAAKGSTLLNYFGIGRETLDYIVDRSTYKQGLYMPGVHLPILAPTELLEDTPDYLLILAWNFASEIIAQQDEYKKRGGQFIIPIPDLKVV